MVQTIDLLEKPGIKFIFPPKKVFPDSNYYQHIFPCEGQQEENTCTEY